MILLPEARPLLQALAPAFSRPRRTRPRRKTRRRSPREGGLKAGHPRLRAVLVEAAWRWVSGDEAAAGRYRRLVANTGSGPKAIVGMARRLRVLLWRLSVHGEVYRMTG